MAFPPVPVFPEGIDSDYTLFLVYNTTETRLCDDNSPWAQEVSVVPVNADQGDIWADNGFGNIEGELFYYDSVDRNVYGKVINLKGCARNLGGSKTKFNVKGTWVRSYVIAEHHNQLVDSMLQSENFVGYNFDTRKETLDWRIRNLKALNIIFDDYNCPDISFTFNIISDNPETGIVAQYEIVIAQPSSVNNFRLDFGDGQFTTSALTGTHVYAINTNIDPIVTVGNDQCTVIQSSVTRTNPNEPTVPTTTVFDIPIPDVPPVPDFTIVPCTVPEPEIIIPTIMPPCFSFEGQIGPLPSSITITNSINMVSSVTFTGLSNSINMVSNASITIIGDIPSMIYVDVPPTIVIEPPIPPTIVVIASNAASFALGVNYADVPNIQVDWGAPPPMEVSLAFAKQPRKVPITQALHNEFGMEFADLFEAADHLKVEYETVGIPSEIKIIAPEFPKMEIDASNIPSTIKVDIQDCNIPKEIFVHTEGVLKTGVIKIDNVIPDSIQVKHDMPTTIEVVGIEIPKMIEVVMRDKLPERIFVEMVKPIPEKIMVEGFPEFLKVDMPRSIEVTGIPDFIPIKFPDEIPQMELVYRGAPIEMKVVMDPFTKSQTPEGMTNCVMITPCR